ncbi:hypothetical protein ACFQ3Z_01080 [Streptomyces nogalater]
MGSGVRRRVRLAPPADGPRHKDRYDDRSTYLLARVEGTVVGTMRLVEDGTGGLPIEQFVAIDELRAPDDGSWSASV